MRYRENYRLDGTWMPDSFAREAAGLEARAAREDRSNNLIFALGLFAACAVIVWLAAWADGIVFVSDFVSGLLVGALSTGVLVLALVVWACLSVAADSDRQMERLTGAMRQQERMN